MTKDKCAVLIFHKLYKEKEVKMATELEVQNSK